MTQTPETRSAATEAAKALAAMAERFNKAAQSLTRMVARLATEDNPTKVVCFSIAKYVNAGYPETEALADIATMLEGAQSPEWRERRAKQRQRQQLARLEWQLRRGRTNSNDTRGGETVLSSWSRDTVLAVAHERRDVLAAAIAACEQRSDDAGILEALHRHMTVDSSVWPLEEALRLAGLSVKGCEVVPFIPRGRAS